MDSYIVPFEEAEAEMVEKRSRFIGHIWRVESEEEARACIEQTKKKHYDARHNCWCYVIRRGVSFATAMTASRRELRGSPC